MSRLAYILSPCSHPLVEYVVFGLYNMNDVLEIPSTQLAWVDNDDRDIQTILEERFPCDQEGFVRVHKVNATPSGISLPSRHSRAYFIFQNPALNDRGVRGSGQNNKDILDRMYKAAKRNPTVLLEAPWSRQGRVGFVEENESVQGVNLRVLRFDRLRWEKEKEHRKTTAKTNEVLPRGYASVRELRILTASMAKALEHRLEKKANIGNQFFRVEIKYSDYLKNQVCRSVLQLYDIGVDAYGKTFWTRTPIGYIWQQGYGYKRPEVEGQMAREIIERWKTEKRKPPKGGMAKRLWTVIHLLAKAKKASPKLCARYWRVR